MKTLIKNKIYIFLFVIVLIAAFLRFYHLATNPPSLTWDEAAWGYNAYSLGIDGKDEFGRFLPHDYLESFGDFKPPVYVYLDILPVKIFGLNEFSTRFPSAFFGVLTVLLTFFLVQRIFWNSKNKKFYALVSAFFLAISPWHIMLSRAAFEANIATFFSVAGIWLFLGGVQEKKWYLILSIFSFVVSIYTFNTARVVAPLLVFLLSFGFIKILLNRKRYVFAAVIIGILMIIPTVKFLLSPQAALRFREVNIFSDINIIKTTNQEIQNDHNVFWSKIIHNRRLVYSADYLKHYLDNLSPIFLFIKGDGNPKFSIQDVGEMYIWDIPFFIVGILLLLKKKEDNWWIIPAWLILGIIPAATARETPHALRIEVCLPTFQIFTAYGFVQLTQRSYKYKRLIIVFLMILLFINLLYFYHEYFTHYPQEYSGEWQYGYKDSIRYVRSVENKYNYIQVTDYLGRPYIYYLFYLKIDPSSYRQTAKVHRDAFGFVHVEGFGKYIFPQDYNYSLSRTKKVLYIDKASNLPKGIKALKTFYLLNGTPVLVAYTI